MKYSIVCKICKNEFSVYKYKKDVAIFCSTKCHGLSIRGGIPWNKGKKIPKMIGNKNGFKKYHTPWNKGKKSPQTTLRNILNNPGGKGEKHWAWKKDRSTLAKRQDRNDMAYKEWRRQVWLRDNFKCKIDNPDCKGKIIAHHILAWSEFVELRYEINNGITLCHAHHPRKRAEEKRLSPYFQGIVSVSK